MSEFTPAPTAERRGIQPPVLIALGVVVVIGLIALFVTFAGGDDDDEDGDRVETAAGAGEVFLEPTDGSGTDPFSESVAAPSPSTTQPLGTPVALGETGVTAPALGTSTTSGAVSSYTGGTPGLYGGTRDQRACDPQKMVSFLAANPDKAQAWADAQGIPVGEVTAYIEALTPVLLRGDTRVTNHGFRNGVATARQSVLQAGTAVLVDKYGEPQARCACGNPLDPPIPTSSTPSYQGTPWQGFSPTGLTVVVKNTTVIRIITIIDVSTGTPFGRPTGPGPDVAMPLPTTTTTAPPSTTPGTASTLPTGPGTFPQPTSPPGPNPPVTSPPATPPPTAPPTTPPPAGPLSLVSATHTVGELKAQWTVDDRNGTARLDLGGTGAGAYSWSVPSQIVAGGTEISFGGATQPPGANINIAIGVRGTGVTFNTTDLAVDVTGTEGRKSAVITPNAGVDEVVISYSIGYSVNVVYTYRR